MIACVIQYMKRSTFAKDVAKFKEDYYKLKCYEMKQQLTDFEKKELTKYLADRMLADARVIYGE